MLIVSALVSGLSLGAMYGLIALGYHVTYAVSNTVNFSQGSSVMLGAVLCYTLWVTLGAPLAVAVVGALALALAGAFLIFLKISPDWQIGAQGAILIIVLAMRALISSGEARR
jgi:branched-chain amino acid transport system permease protein